jgi:hypothetical protein
MGCGGCGGKTASGQGIWLNHDPLQEQYDVNLYHFNHNSPLAYVDSDGRNPLLIAFLVGAAVSAVMTPYTANAPGPNDATYPPAEVSQILANGVVGGATAAVTDGLLRLPDSLGSPSPKPEPEANLCSPKMVDPGNLRLPPNREGADPFKLLQQMQQYGSSTQGMPPIEVLQDANGEMMITDGVTRATRINIYNQINSTVNNVPVIVIQQTTADLSTLPTVANPP